jgi:hypothetical protein
MKQSRGFRKITLLSNLWLQQQQRILKPESQRRQGLKEIVASIMENKLILACELKASFRLEF